MDGRKPHISVVVVGHVDSGKSTTTGHFVYKVGAVDERTIKKFEKESAEIGRASFKYAWVLDKTASERSRGITIQQTTTKAETENNTVTIIDAPGHRDFIKNLITGTANADGAIICVPASQGEYETAIGLDGCLLEQCRLVFIAGAASQVLIAINKMDSVDYSETRYNEIKKEMYRQLKKIGIKPQLISDIPISGLVGDNLVEVSEKMPWYKGWTGKARDPTVEDAKAPNAFIERSGKTLYDWLDQLVEPRRNYVAEFRGTIQSTMKVPNVGFVVTGRIEQGTVTPGQLITFAPSNKTAEIKTIEMHRQSIKKAVSGDSIGICCKNLEDGDVVRGDVFGLTSSDFPRPCKTFTAQLIILELLSSKPKTKGDSSGQDDGRGVTLNYTPTCFVHTAHGPVKFVKVESFMDRKTYKDSRIVEEGETVRIKENDMVRIVLQPMVPMCVETIKFCPSLGRFSLRDSKKCVGFGVILSVDKKSIEELKVGGAMAKQLKTAAKVSRASKRATG